MTKRFFISTSIPYVNAAPHIGHALEYVQTDTIARYHRLLGEDVFFLSGSDENSLKNVQAAEKLGIPVQKLCEENAKKFSDFKKILNISFNQFIRTTEKRHFEGAQKLWKACRKEDIYKKSYKGLYCVGCEQFYTESELVEGLCPEHKTKPELVEEENYFFRLSSYQKQLEELISSDKLKVLPDFRKNEVLSFIKRGLEDFSISRSVKRAHGWGVPVPGDSSLIMYVWFDALSNYITALDYASSGDLFKKFWLDNPFRVHVIGKGISRFHAVYWPAMLLSAGVPLPCEEFVHGYVTIEGEKISKSLGNVIDPAEVVKKYGIDPVRYYLLREIPAYGDGDFSEHRFKEVYNADLANGLGNLVQRVSKLAESAKLKVQSAKPQLKVQSDKDYDFFLREYRFNEALAWIWEKVTEQNKYIDEKEPWKLQGKELEEVLNYSIEKILEIAFLLQPFLPETAEKTIKQFTSTEIKSTTPLFPRIK